MAERTHRLNKPFHLTRRFWMIVVLILFLGFSGFTIWTYRTSMTGEGRDWLSRMLDARVETILVSGVQHADAQSLRDAIGLNQGDSLVGYNVAEARARLEALPWMRYATVERHLPSTLKVQVYEKQPIARLLDEEKEFVLDKDGMPIAESDGRFYHLPLLTGDAAAVEAPKLFALLAQAPEFSVTIEGAERIGKRRWNLRMENGITVQLPEENPMEAIVLLKKLEDKRQIFSVDNVVIDLRLNDRIVLRLPENVDVTSGWPPQAH